MFTCDYEILTVPEVMDFLNISENSAYKILNSGELNAFKIGRIWKIPRKELDKYIDKSLERMLNK